MKTTKNVERKYNTIVDKNDNAKGVAIKQNFEIIEDNELKIGYLSVQI